jgi:hypothetical protein
MPNCCANCFSHDAIKEYINETGDLGDCDYCLSIKIKTIDAVILFNLLEPVLALYTEANFDFGETIQYHLEDDWGPIVEDSLDDETKNLLWNEMLSPTMGKDWEGVKRGDLCELAYSPGTFWDELSYKLKHENRFFLSANDSNDDYILELLPELLQRKQKTISAGELLYRLRKNKKNKEKCYKISEMGAPSDEKATPGRANPRGISVLYVSSDESTAVAEMRPFRGQLFSMAKFIVKEPLKVVDLSDFTSIDNPFHDNILIELIDNTLLNSFAEALSRPLTPSDEPLEYIPSQYLSEMVKNLGYDGIKYRSSHGKGYNYAIFSQHKVEGKHVSLLIVEFIQPSFRIARWLNKK